MSIVARTWLMLALVAALLAYGGSGDLVRPLLTVAVAVALVLAALGLRTRFHPPPLSWIALLFLPPLLIALVQVVPFGWHHPWLTEDVAALGIAPATWSIDPAASTAALVWLATLAGLAMTVCLLARGERVRALVEVLIAVAALTAVLGLCLALTATPWPSATSLTRARGPFIYPNHAAAFWASCLPLATLIAHRRGGLLRWGAVAVLALALLLSGSRGGILVAALVMAPLSVLLLPRRRRWWWAAGGVLVVSAWLWLIGIGDVTDKFTRLRGAEGVTLNGRATMWQAALPVITDAGALGSGGGTTIPAYRRSGDTYFADLLVNHLHSDPLEWWLEYGWLGLLVGAVALAAALFRLRPDTGAWEDPGRRVLIIGAAAGLVILGLHACGDFIWHSPAVAMTGVLLLCVLALAGHTRADATSGRGRTQMLCAGAAVLLLIGAWGVWGWHASELRARDVERVALARQAAGLPLTGAEAVERALRTPPQSVRLAVTRAWLAHASDDLAGARAWLAEAARLAPGDASAWVQRALLAARAGDAAGVSVALRRALAWAPAWPDIQQTALHLVAQQTVDGGSVLLQPDQTAAIVTAVLAVDREQPRWFFPLAVEVLGEARVLAALRSAGPRLSAAAEPWLARHGPVEDWIALRRRLTPPGTRLPAAFGPLAGHLLEPGTWKPLIPVEREERRALAELLTTTALPLPHELAEAIERDGPPWARWARPIDLLDPVERAALSTLLRSELHRGWARVWADRLLVTGNALAGDSAMITRDCPPQVLARLADVAPYRDPALVDETLRRRARALLERWGECEWQELPGAGRWTWWFGDGSGEAVVTCQRWSGLVIDGTWHGWIRGRLDLAPLLGEGLKRVVLLEP